MRVACISPTPERSRCAKPTAEGAATANRGPIRVRTHLRRNRSRLRAAEPGLSIAVVSPAIKRARLGDGAAVAPGLLAAHHRKRPRQRWIDDLGRRLELHDRRRLRDGTGVVSSPEPEPAVAI